MKDFSGALEKLNQGYALRVHCCPECHGLKKIQGAEWDNTKKTVILYICDCNFISVPQFLARSKHTED